jgi:transcriptional regulator with XRE-family HTH domain
MAGPAMTGPGERDQRSRPLLRTMVGEVLRRVRLEQGRTLAEVSRAARVSMPYLSELERGRKEGSSEILAAICDALRIDLADLLVSAGHDLARVEGDLAAGRPAVIKLDDVRGRRASSAFPDQGLDGRELPGRGRPGPGDARCLLAA